MCGDVDRTFRSIGLRCFEHLSQRVWWFVNENPCGERLQVEVGGCDLSSSNDAVAQVVKKGTLQKCFVHARHDIARVEGHETAWFHPTD